MADDNEIRLRDHWWLFRYRWHVWRRKRAAKALAFHQWTLMEQLGIEVPPEIEVRL